MIALAGFPAGVALAQDAPNSSLYSGQMQRRPMYVMKQNVSQAPNGAVDSNDQLPPVPPQATPPQYGPTTGQYPYSGPGTPLGSNWYEIPLPPLKEAKINDIITIRVDLGARSASEGDFQRRKNATYDAILKDWPILDGLRWIKPSPQSNGDPRIQGTLNSLSRVQSDLETSESVKFDIAATVQSVLPNGTLVIEAHREARINDEDWIVSLSGICRREDIQPGNVILSKDIAQLKIDKREVGAIRDSYKRGWFTRFYDMFNPF
jgi:flagellar L-ring protein precursor FlgH